MKKTSSKNRAAYASLRLASTSVDHFNRRVIASNVLR